ncbi:MAG: exo-alpha-sialidase [Bacteroidota bacterium]
MKIYHIALLLLLPISFGCNESLEFKASSPVADQQNQNSDKNGTANTVFRSADGGQTWQDISKGLPEKLQEDSSRRNNFFANDKGLYLKVGNGLYHSETNATAPFWTKAIVPVEHSSIAPVKPGIIANNYWGVHLKTKNGTSVWGPIFDSSSEPRMRSVFETAGAAIFIGTDRGFFKTADNGKTWKHVYAEGWAGHFAESDGVLVSTSIRRLIRSTDNGENWALVIRDSSLVFDVKQIKGGFAALIAPSASNPRGIRTSYDGGKTWQPADTGNEVFIDSLWQTWNDRPRVQAFQASIIPVGENFFSVHPGGIFRSSDKGKTWKFLLPSIEGKVFNLFVSGNVIYAIPSKGGC